MTNLLSTIFSSDLSLFKRAQASHFTEYNPDRENLFQKVKSFI